MSPNARRRTPVRPPTAVRTNGPGRPFELRLATIQARGKSWTAILADERACSAGYKPTLLQLFGLLQLQSIERKIL
jgi:hypothetical protein